LAKKRILIWRTPMGRPRSGMRIVTWCRDSGDWDQKSHMAVVERRLRLRMTFLGVDEIRELIRGADEKDRFIVAYHVPIAFLGFSVWP
jgi:hypothetical protein